MHPVVKKLLFLPKTIAGRCGLLQTINKSDCLRVNTTSQPSAKYTAVYIFPPKERTQKHLRLFIQSMWKHCAARTCLEGLTRRRQEYCPHSMPYRSTQRSRQKGSEYQRAGIGVCLSVSIKPEHHVTIGMKRCCCCCCSFSYCLLFLAAFRPEHGVRSHRK